MSGDGMALAGLILGYTMIGIALLVLIVVIIALGVLIPTISQTTGSFNSLMPFGW